MRFGWGSRVLRVTSVLLPVKASAARALQNLSALTITATNLLIVESRPTRSSDGIFLHVREVEGRPVTITKREIITASEIQRADEVNVLEEPKAFQIIKNIAPHCTAKTRITGFAHRFEELLAAGFEPQVDVLFVGVDNNSGRRIAAAYSYAKNTPLVNVAVDGRAEHAHIMIQETGKACIGCMNPGYLHDRRAPCFVPSCIDCLFVADGLALFALTSVLLNRPRNWNFRNVHVAGFMEDAPKWIERKPNCPLCSNNRA